MKIIITGSAGFIGSNLFDRLNTYKNYDVFGIDNFISRSKEEEQLKLYRVEKLIPSMNHWTLDMRNKNGLYSYLNYQKPDLIIHLAAIPGVRDSVNNPNQYIENNILSFLNLLEYAKEKPTPVIYASSSTIYGDQSLFDNKYSTINPLSPYAFSKISCEMLAQTYFNLYKIPLIGLRLFSVYGPYGRPDMVYYDWTKKIFHNEQIKINGSKLISRSFTYINKVIDAIILLIKNGIPENHFIYNIGNKKNNTLEDLIQIIETQLHNEATYSILEYRKGDAFEIKANPEQFENDFNFDFSFPLEDGMKEFINWYLEYQSYQKNKEQL